MNIIQIIDDFIKRTPLPELIGLKWSRRVLLIFFVIIIFIIFSIIQFSSGSKITRFTGVKKGEFIVDLVESGEIEAYSRSVISAPFMWGTNLQITELKPEGSLVEKGDILVEFDSRDLKEQRDLAVERIETLKADLEKLKSQHSLTISNLENMVTLNEYSLEQAELRLKMREFESEAKKQEAKIQFKESENNLKMAKTELESQKIINKSQLLQSQIQVNQARNNLKSIDDRIEKFKLRSPTNGIVVYMDVRGERPREGLNARPGWPLMQIPDLSRMQTSFYISEMDREKIKVGQSCIITLDAYPDSIFQGEVRDISRIALTVDNKNWLKGYKVYADIDEIAKILKPGMTSKIKIILEKYEDVVYVPIGAVFEIKGQPVVFPERKNKAYAVYPGIRNDDSVIIKRGVTPDMKLAMISSDERADLLGEEEEKERIVAINKTLKESYKIFEEYGILYDYQKEFAEDEEKTDKKSNIDIQKLPSFLQKRLNKDKNERESEPKIEVGRSGRNTDEKKFKVSPEMMEKPKKKKMEEKDN